MPWVASPGAMVRRMTSAALAMRVSPSASLTRMLREASTSTGMTTSPETTGGKSRTGRAMKNATTASDKPRSAVSTPRCAAVSGTSGRQ